MRTLSEIIEDVTDGKMPTHEECYYALKVYQKMFAMDHRQLRVELTTPKDELGPDFIRKQRAQISFDMFKGALAKPPKEWLGEE